MIADVMRRVITAVPIRMLRIVITTLVRVSLTKSSANLRVTLTDLQAVQALMTDVREEREMTDAHHATDENNTTTETTTLRRTKTKKKETRTKRRRNHTKRRRINVLIPQHGGRGRSGARSTSPFSLPDRPTHFHGVFSFLFSFP